MMNTKQFIEFLVEGNGLGNNGATAYGSKCNNLCIPVTGGKGGNTLTGNVDCNLRSIHALLIMKEAVCP